MGIDDPTAVSGGPAAGRPRSSMGAVFLTIFLDLAGFSIIFPLSPNLLEHYLAVEGRDGILGGIIRFIEAASPLALDDQVYTAALFGGILGSLYSLLQFLCAPLWGSISDRRGRRPVLIISIAGIAASHLLWALSGSFALFIAARLVAGAMGGNISVATAAAADMTSRENRAKAMGIVGAAFGLGFVFGPAIGGGLSRIDLAARFPGLAAYGVNPFSAAALGALVLALANLATVMLWFKETLAPGERRAAGTRGSASLLGFFRRSTISGVRTTILAYFIYLFAFSGMEFTLTFLAHERFGFGPRENMWLFIFVGVIMAIIQGGLVRRIVPRLGERRTAILGISALLPGFVILGCTTSIAVLYAGLAFLGVGSGLMQPAMTSLASLYAPSDRQGEVMGAFRSLGAFSRILGPLAATVIFWRFGSAWPYVTGAVILLAPLILVASLPLPSKVQK